MCEKDLAFKILEELAQKYIAGTIGEADLYPKRDEMLKKAGNTTRKELMKRPAAQSLATGTSADDEMAIEKQADLASTSAPVTPPSKSAKTNFSAFGLDAVVPDSGFMSNYSL